MSAEVKQESEEKVGEESEEQVLVASIEKTRSHIHDYRSALDSGQLDYALEQWTEAVQVLQKLYHNEQVFLLKYRLLMKQRKAAAYR